MKILYSGSPLYLQLFEALNLIPKKGKVESYCASLDSSLLQLLCILFELLFRDELHATCNTPPYQLGLKEKSGCADKLAAVANALADAELAGESFVIAGHNVRRTLDSLKHSAMLPKIER